MRRFAIIFKYVALIHEKLKCKAIFENLSTSIEYRLQPSTDDLNANFQTRVLFDLQE